MKSIADNSVLLTVFTPTYNRAHTLSRTYASLCAQTCKDFLWLIIDDGSTDGTEKLVKEWQKKEKSFNIHYVYKPNGGMHTAHNAAYEIINTELNVCIDSDDAMANNAVELILKKWAEAKSNDVAGLIALNSDFHGQIIGKGFPDEMVYTTVSGYYAAGGSGDKKLIYRTDVINSVPPYPVFEGEKYVSLSYKYRLIDQQYKMAVLNEIIGLVEYQADGSTMNMWRQYRNNPRGFAFWRLVRMQYPDSKKRLLIDYVHYCSSSILAKDKGYIKKTPHPVLCTLCAPVGLVFSIFTIIKAK